MIEAKNIPIYCKYDKLVPIKDLVPNERNPNTHPARQIELLSNIIKSRGWRVPITVSNKSGLIVRGHGRYEAAKKLNIKKVPVDYQDYETEEEEQADLLADNKIAEMSENDPEGLLSMLEDLNSLDVDIELSGYDFADMAVLRDALDKVALIEEDIENKEKKSLSLGPKQNEVKIVICVDDIATVEKAIQETGERKRGAAIVKICKEWLNGKR